MSLLQSSWHLSVYTSPTKNFQNFLLSSLHPIGKPHLDKSELYWSANWSAAVFTGRHFSLAGRQATSPPRPPVKLVGLHPRRSDLQICRSASCQTAWTCSRWRRRTNTRRSRTSCGVLTPGTHGDAHRPHRQGQSSPQDEGLWRTAQLGARRKASQWHPEDRVESVRICRM
jgi:hypothetical protein